MRRSTSALFVGVGFLLGVWIAGRFLFPQPVTAYSQFIKNGDSVAVLCNGELFTGNYCYSNNEILAMTDSNGYIVLINKTKITAVVLVTDRKKQEEVNGN